jgi:DNA-binding NarL/FixJ family response regulator
MVCRVLIADDNPDVRKGIRAHLNNRADVEVCGEATDGREAMEQALAKKPDLLILDVVMPEFNGIAAAVLLKKRLPHTRIVLFTMYGETVGNLARLANVKVIPKPDGMPVLLHLIDEWVGGCSDSKSLQASGTMAHERLVS